MKRIEFIPLVGAGLMAASPQKLPHIVTYRDAGCGCCEGWVKAARAAGYMIELHDLGSARAAALDLAIDYVLVRRRARAGELAVPNC